MFFLLIFIAVITIFAFRIVHVVSRKPKSFGKKCAKTLVVIGSGGHTSEMTRQLIKLNPRIYQPRLYVLADSDSSSKSKIKVVESRFRDAGDNYFIKEIPRSRSVKQSYFTSIFTTIYSTVISVPVVYSFKPDLILCNGPGTCIPICVVAFFMKLLCISDCRIVFIESVCRVNSLSLSGKILLRFADKVLVQWPELHEKYPKTEYIGRL